MARRTTPQGDWPYLWLDVTYVKVRANGRIISVAVIVAVAVNSDGRREVLGMAIGASEAETPELAEGAGRTFCLPNEDAITRLVGAPLRRWPTWGCGGPSTL